MVINKYARKMHINKLIKHVQNIPPALCNGIKPIAPIICDKDRRKIFFFTFLGGVEQYCYSYLHHGMNPLSEK